MSPLSHIKSIVEYICAVFEAPLRAHGFTLPLELFPIFATSEMSVIFGALLVGFLVLKSGILTRNTSFNANKEQNASDASPKTLNVLASGLRVMSATLSSTATNLSKYFKSNK